MATPSSFAGGDQHYLRTEQYADASKLALRARLHERYSTAEVPWFDWVAERLDIPAGASVLEVGCGAGWLWAQGDHTVPSGVSIELTDLSQGMVDEAVERVSSTGLFSSVSGRVADLQRLPFDDGSKHLVVANHMLYHLPDPSAGVAELGRVVAPDGVVVAATNGVRHMREVRAIRAEVFGEATTDLTTEVFGADSGFALLRARFDDVRWLQHHDELRCTEPQHVVDYMCSTPPGESADAETLDALRTAIADVFAANDDVMTITKDTGLFICR
ncbi:class I SAM-dependent methyltransferase [Ilumatobacter coccineus]|uniref:Putative methyltransferase n=1 Tax=Ilumatobacter coccineus (strain NBRC 103263 / KCTC 29153 / YM16-304) TaxID=1313172 RepID=A0A6C7EBW2_ILUCY|nr:methyltransferase domain-containing protein [Ilumatobacter coccineus]BAN01506.1 putative methyltransferase [Ilumatobacter coccineus YM16-304]